MSIRAHRLAVLTAVLAFLPIAPVQAEIDIYSTADSFGYSGPLPLYQVAKDWQGDFEGGDLAFTYNRFELGVAWQNLRIGYVARYDYRLEFSEDTARFYYEEKNNFERNDSRQYDVYLDGMHQRSQGAAIHYELELTDDFSVTPSVSVLYANAILDGELSGRASFLGDDTFSGNLSVDYHYLRDVLFEREIKPKNYRGIGYTFDLAAKWEPTDNWRLHLKTHDLLGYIRWRDVPHTKAVANTEPVQTTDPFERYKNAAVQGIESYENYNQRLTPRAEFDVRYRHGAFSFPTKLYVGPEQAFLFPSIAYSVGSWELALIAEPFIKAVGFRLNHPWLSLSLISDHLDYQKAKFVSLGFDVHVPLR